MKLKRLPALLALTTLLLVGLPLLAGYFFDFPLLQAVNQQLLRWGVALAAAALLAGLINLAKAHVQRIASGRTGWGYSVVTLAAFALTLLAVGWYGALSKPASWLFDYIQLPVETSLLAVLAVVLVLAAARLVVQHPTWPAFVFLGSVLLSLLGAVAFQVQSLELIATFSAWLQRVPATAGLRGILLGIVIGVIAIGVRVLSGAERPYAGRQKDES